MKTLAFLLFLLFCTGWLAGPVAAQDLAGTWQGVELNPGSAASEYWPAVLTIRPSKTAALTAELYQIAGSQPEVTGTFAMRGSRTAAGLRLVHLRVLAETNPSGANWCLGTIVFTYNAALEKLTGRSYYPVQGCNNGTAELYRVRLKSAAAVARGAASTLRVSGRNVRWFADAALKRPLATGNSYRTRLAKTTTFYITQGFYPTARSPVVPVTVRTVGAGRVAPGPVAPARPPAVAGVPLVLPTVLFRLSTAELLPEASPALDALATELKNRPGLRIRVAGHTDRIGEDKGNQLLSEQRAEAVKDYLVRTGVADERIETIGYGASKLLFPTPDVRNRRVEVTELR